jgi:hypothetical protein
MEAAAVALLGGCAGAMTERLWKRAYITTMTPNQREVDSSILSGSTMLIFA